MNVKFQYLKVVHKYVYSIDIQGHENKERVKEN
jgi:hypothetical protein